MEIALIKSGLNFTRSRLGLSYRKYEPATSHPPLPPPSPEQDPERVGGKGFEVDWRIVTAATTASLSSQSSSHCTRVDLQEERRYRASGQVITLRS